MLIIYRLAINNNKIESITAVDYHGFSPSKSICDDCFQLGKVLRIAITNLMFRMIKIMKNPITQF